MLSKIRCDKFRDGQVLFHPGLNVVLGDDKATNSIGKTTILLVIDFALGGDTFNKVKVDAINELGHHDYYFVFDFDGVSYFFKRGTLRPDLVCKCSAEFKEIETIGIDEYREFLKVKYGLESEKINFRAFVSLFSRIWGKDNYNVQKPLHSFPNQNASSCVDNLLKIYNKYDSVDDLSENLKVAYEARSAFSKAANKEIVPKISRRKYKENAIRIEEIESEINDIKSNLSKYATNISEIVNREILDLKVVKDDLLRTKFIIDKKLQNIRRNLAGSRYIKSKHLMSLTEYFPDVNIERLSVIESFHDELSKILKKELAESERELDAQVNMINNEIDNIDKKISERFSKIENPSAIIDRVYDLANAFGASKNENKFFEKGERLREIEGEAREKLTSEKLRVVKIVEDIINKKIRELVTLIYSHYRKSPKLSLTENNYTFEVFEDTGTGKAYSNLLIFDMAVFLTTKLPLIIHDSFLYKNIENDAVANLVRLYHSLKRQSFISIDEIHKYGDDAKTILLKNKVMQLSDNHVLYIKDWRPEA